MLVRNRVMAVLNCAIPATGGFRGARRLAGLLHSSLVSNACAAGNVFPAGRDTVKREPGIAEQDVCILLYSLHI